MEPRLFSKIVIVFADRGCPVLIEACQMPAVVAVSEWIRKILYRLRITFQRVSQVAKRAAQVTGLENLPIELVASLPELIEDFGELSLFLRFSQ
jgi:hypothetical protein